LKRKLIIGFVVNGFDGLHGVSQTIEASILSYSAWLPTIPAALLEHLQGDATGSVGG
jgi:hypothetical protein